MIVNSSGCQAPGWATHSLSLYLIDTHTYTLAHRHTQNHTHRQTQNTILHHSDFVPDLIVQTIPGREMKRIIAKGFEVKGN